MTWQHPTGGTGFVNAITNLFVEMLNTSPSLTNTSDGSVVASWSNLVGTVNFQLATATPWSSASPHYRATGGPNGQAAIDFKNGSGTTTGIGFVNSFASNQPVTVFLVGANPISTVSASSSVQTLFVGGSEFAQIKNSGGSLFTAGSTIATPIPALAYTNWCVYTFVFDGPRSYCRINKKLVASGDSGAGTFGQLWWGNDGGGNTSQNIGMMSCFLAYQAAPDTNSLQTVEDGLIAYFGATGFDMITNWAQQVFLNSGSYPSSSTISAVSTYYNGLVSDLIEQKMLAVSVCATDSVSAYCTPFINRKGTTNLWENHNFVAGDLGVNGLHGNGTTKYIDTKIQPSSQLTANDTGIAIYLYAHATTGTALDTGAQTASDNLAFYPYFGGTTLSDEYNFTAGQGRASVASPGNGYYFATRTAANSSVVYYATSSSSHASIVSIATSGGTIGNVNLNIFLFNLNLGGTPVANGWSDGTISYVAYTRGMTSSESSSQYNRAQTLRTDFGGGFR